MHDRTQWKNGVCKPSVFEGRCGDMLRSANTDRDELGSQTGRLCDLSDYESKVNVFEAGNKWERTCKAVSVIKQDHLPSPNNEFQKCKHLSFQTVDRDKSKELGDLIFKRQIGGCCSSHKYGAGR